MSAAVQERASGLTGTRLAGLLLMCGLAITFDGYDLVVLGATAGTLMEDFGIGPQQIGAIGSATLVGMMLGAIFIGSLADRFGRRVVLISSVIWFSLWMVVAALAPNPGVFGFARFMCGLGLGGCMPTATALVVEYAPKNRGNFYYVIMQSGFAVGGILAASLGIALLADGNWRIMYAIGAAPLLLVVLPALKFLPESLDFLVNRGRREEAARLAERLQVDLPEPKSGSPKVPLAQLFSGGYARSTIMFWLATFSALLMVYGLNTWLPEIMRDQGYSLGSSLTFLLVFNIGSIVGSLLGGQIADRVGSKPVIAVSFALAAVSAVGLSLRPDSLLLYALIAIGGYGAIGTQNLINPFVASYYPAQVRATGSGWALGVGRLGAVVGPMLGGLVMASSLGGEWNFYMFAVVAAIGTLAVLLVTNRPSL